MNNLKWKTAERVKEEEKVRYLAVFATDKRDLMSLSYTPNVSCCWICVGLRDRGEAAAGETGSSGETSVSVKAKAGN